MPDIYKPTGQLQGDPRPLPDRGTTTGMINNPFGSDADGIGHDTGADAINAMGGIASACRSDGKDSA